MLLLFIAVSSLYTPPTGPRAGTESLRWQSPLTVAERLEALGVAWDPLAKQRERMRGLLAVYRERVGDKEVVTKMLKDYNALLSFSSRWPSVWADPEMAAHPSHESVHS